MTFLVSQTLSFHFVLACSRLSCLPIPSLPLTSKGQNKEWGQGRQISGPFSTSTVTPSVDFHSAPPFDLDPFPLGPTQSPSPPFLPPLCLSYSPFWNDWWLWCFILGQFISFTERGSMDSRPHTVSPFFLSVLTLSGPVPSLCWSPWPLSFPCFSVLSPSIYLNKKKKKKDVDDQCFISWHIS